MRSIMPLDFFGVYIKYIIYNINGGEIKSAHISVDTK